MNIILRDVLRLVKMQHAQGDKSVQLSLTLKDGRFLLDITDLLMEKITVWTQDVLSEHVPKGAQLNIKVDIANEPYMPKSIPSPWPQGWVGPLKAPPYTVTSQYAANAEEY